VPEEKLHGPQVTSLSVNQGRFGPSQGMRAEETGVQADHGDPVRDETRILPRREASAFATSAAKQKGARLPLRDAKSSVNQDENAYCLIQ
jgi:hypothetical protein